MKNLIACSLLLTFCFTFCKKKDSTPDPPPTNSNTNSSSNTNLAPSTGGDYCSLQTTYTYYDSGTSIAKDSQVVASFYSAPVTSVAPTNINAGTVTLNGINIPFSSPPAIYYGNTTPINIAGALTWSVSGSGTVTAFSQSYTPVYAKYTGANVLPDTCVKANGVNITISGVTNNQSSVVIYLNSGSSSAFKYILGSNGTVSFTSSDLSSFAAHQPVIISIYFTNSFTATLGGIKRGFTNIVNYQKVSYLK